MGLGLSPSMPPLSLPLDAYEVHHLQPSLLKGNPQHLTPKPRIWEHTQVAYSTTGWRVGVLCFRTVRCWRIAMRPAAAGRLRTAFFFTKSDCSKVGISTRSPSAKAAMTCTCQMSISWAT